MGFFDKIFKNEEAIDLKEISIKDDEIVAIADGTIIDVSNVPDEVFSQQMMGKSIAFKYDKDKVILCSPCNGRLSVLFPTGHAYGIVSNEGVEILIHCGVNTVEANGNGFKILNKKQDDIVKAGDPIVEVDIKKLKTKYDMSTMLIITNNNNKDIDFIDYNQEVERGQSIIK